MTSDEIDYRVTAAGVEKAFGDNKVLQGISFTVQRGTATAIIGPSGSGKTTLLRTLNALDRADAGVIRIDDIEIDFAEPVSKQQLRQFRSRSGFVFQSHNLFPHKTVLQNIIEGPVVVQKQPKDQAIADAITLLEQVGCPRRKTSTPINSPVVNSNGSASPGHWHSNPNWCCSTNPPPRWIRNWSARCSPSSKIWRSKAGPW